MLNKHDKYLLDTINRLGTTGYLDENPRASYKDGNEANALSVRGGVYEVYDLEKGEFPITWTRPIPLKTTIGEMLVIYQDQSNKLEDFHNRNINFWDEWDIGDNTIGLRYGATVAKYNLINELIDGLRNNPFGRRHMINLYQYSDLRETDGLHPCMFLTMWTVSKVGDKKYLDLTLVGRSSDLLVAGTGMNQTQYVAMQIAIANDLGYEVGLFEFYRKNVHVYDRHLEQLEETIKRLELMQSDEAERTTVLKLNRPVGTSFFDIKVNDFELVDYSPIKPQLKFELGI